MAHDALQLPPDIAVFKPSAHLREYVRYYWVLKSSRPFNTLTFPIGCPQIIFHRKSPLVIPELMVAQNKLTISGQVNFPAHIASAGDTEMVVAVFHPHTIGQFISASPAEFYNTEIPGHSLGCKSLDQLSSQVFNCEDSLHCINLIDNWLRKQLSRPDPIHRKRIGHAIASMASTPSLSIDTLATQTCLSQRQFRRIFNNYVGMASKEYARIMRFQKSLWMLQCKHHDYTAIAHDCGYSDQAHFIREFRQFSTLTPATIVSPYSDLFCNPA